MTIHTYHRRSMGLWGAIFNVTPRNTYLGRHPPRSRAEVVFLIDASVLIEAVHFFLSRAVVVTSRTFFFIDNNYSAVHDAAEELGRGTLSKHQIQPGYGDEQADAGRVCRTRLARPNFQARTRTGKYRFSLFSRPREGLATLPG